MPKRLRDDGIQIDQASLSAVAGVLPNHGRPQAHFGGDVNAQRRRLPSSIELPGDAQLHRPFPKLRRTPDLEAAVRGGVDHDLPHLVEPLDADLGQLGDDSLTLPLMAMGARGVISVVGNMVPKDMIALVSAVESGNLEEARRWHHKLFPLCRDMLGLATNPIPIKAAMKMLGRDSGELRMPMTPLSAEQEAKLRTTLSEYGLL